MPGGFIMERPKMSKATWEALKAHILLERRKKKEEQEADAAEERERKERERRRKESQMTLGETREELERLEQRKMALNEEKHELFLQLKKVLNQEETQRRQQILKEQQVRQAETDILRIGGASYPPPGTIQLGGHPPPMFMQPLSLTRPPLYKMEPRPSVVAPVCFPKDWFAILETLLAYKATPKKFTY
ncbi:unnamed protein product [Darwinula stevensoni]|uniref:G protein pathway suppressor 2 n=1 Tax=Darwinula stevensoni TaxID=69355 RepID=A0A7R9FQZ6_9CRUS|nr:unnamed protein product [Darwinula stevensoni]CAG0900672.1 unnamed protein product [Darwinula stevensoni]